jgi:hypothetical protein
MLPIPASRTISSKATTIQKFMSPKDCFLSGGTVALLLLVKEDRVTRCGKQQQSSSATTAILDCEPPSMQKDLEYQECNNFLENDSYYKRYIDLHAEVHQTSRTSSVSKDRDCSPQDSRAANSKATRSHSRSSGAQEPQQSSQ